MRTMLSILMVLASSAMATTHTTSDPVTSDTGGNVLKVGGKLAAATAASTAVGPSSNTEATFDNTSTTVAASTIGAGTVIHVVGEGICTATHNNDTFTVKVKVGSTAVLTLPALDVANSDIFAFDDYLVGRAAPGAAAAVVGTGNYVFGAADTATRRTAILASTNFATNGALVVSASGQFSASDPGNSCRLDVWTVEVMP